MNADGSRTLLVSKLVPLGRASEAFSALEQRGAMKILVDCRDV